MAERYWTGEITTESHALKVVNYTAGAFALLASLYVLSWLTKPNLPSVITTLLFAIPALSFWRTKGVAAARFLFWLNAVVVAMCFGLGGYLYFDRDLADPMNMVPIGVLGLFWLIGLVATRRGIEGAKFLRSTRQQTAVAASQ